MTLEFRDATPADVEGIARIHTANWQRGYRGAFSDAFLDDELPGQHLHEWRTKLATPAPHQFVHCALDNANIIGFVCGFGGFDATLGSFVDNLHIDGVAQGRGIGVALMQRIGAQFATQWPREPVFLYVVAGNTAAQRFYERIGGRNSGIVTEVIHGQTVSSHLYVWDSPLQLRGSAL